MYHISKQPSSLPRHFSGKNAPLTRLPRPLTSADAPSSMAATAGHTPTPHRLLPLSLPLSLILRLPLPLPLSLCRCPPCILDSFPRPSRPHRRCLVCPCPCPCPCPCRSPAPLRSPVAMLPRPRVPPPGAGACEPPRGCSLPLHNVRRKKKCKKCNLPPPH